MISRPPYQYLRLSSEPLPGLLDRGEVSDLQLGTVYKEVAAMLQSELTNQSAVRGRLRRARDLPDVPARRPRRPGLNSGLDLVCEGVRAFASHRRRGLSLPSQAPELALACARDDLPRGDRALAVVLTPKPERK
jgi:hypothetical protein